MAKKELAVGCANPFSMAEEIVGKRLDWSKAKDEYDALAECFGITKEGYLSNESPIEAPYLASDEEGNTYRLSDDKAEERVVSFLSKYARPRPKAVKAAAPMSIEKQRNSVLDVILKKNISVTANDAADKPASMVNSAMIRKPVKPDKPTLVGNTGPVIPKPAPVGGEDPQKSTDKYEWKDKGYFFNEAAQWSDVCQNNIGDCYFLSSLCSIAYTDPYKIRNSAALRATYIGGVKTYTPWHEIQFYVPNTAYSDFELWSEQKKTIQSFFVSEDVLVSRATNRNYGVCGPKEMQGEIPQSRAEADSCWAAVYEKAFAKFLDQVTSDRPNMNGRIDQGYADVAMKAILHTEQVKNMTLYRKSIDEIWELSSEANRRPMCATIYQSTTKDASGAEVKFGKGGTKSDYLAMGLYISHVYSLLGTYTADDTRYIILRNPHGMNPNELKNNPKVYHKEWSLDPEISEEAENPNVFQHLSGHDDPKTSQGLFLLEINEFKRVFDIITYYTGE